MISIPDSNLKVLESLHTYKFLTVPQFVRLGVNTHAQSVQRTLRRFKQYRKPFIGKKDFGFIAGVGNLHSVYYLTRHGAALLAEYYRVDISEINYPKGVPDFSKDYFHRWYTVDVHIAFRQWAKKAGTDIEFFHTYFDHTGSNRAGGRKGRLRPRTKIDLADGSFVPDAIYLAISPDGKKHFAVVEVHNGKDTGRFLQQMEKHALALHTGAVAEAYGLALNNRVRWVFEHEATMKAAMRRIQQEARFTPLRDWVDFNTVERIRENITVGWCSWKLR